MRTFLRRDVPSLQPAVPVARLERFWCMLAHGHGQLSSAAELARSLGIRDQVARRYLDLLTQTLVLLTQQPWHESVAKCQVKSPEVCVADPGLVHALLDIRDMNDLLGHPEVGVSWEGFLLAQVTQHLGVRREECHHWATHQGAELGVFRLSCW